MLDLVIVLLNYLPDSVTLQLSMLNNSQIIDKISNKFPYDNKEIMMAFVLRHSTHHLFSCPKVGSPFVCRSHIHSCRAFLNCTIYILLVALFSVSLFTLSSQTRIQNRTRNGWSKEFFLLRDCHCIFLGREKK